MPAFAKTSGIPAALAATLLACPIGAAEPSAVSLELGSRHAQAAPFRHGCGRTGGGAIDVQQPSADTLVVTMTGAAAAYPNPARAARAGFEFALDQCFDVRIRDPKVKRASLSLEGRVIGLLRSPCRGGQAEQGAGWAAVACGPAELLRLCVPAHTVGNGENLSVNCREGAVSVPLTAGCYSLRQTFRIEASAPRCAVPRKAPSAEFAPEPALDPAWISGKEPFHGAAKKDFGFQIILRVAAELEGEPAPPR